ncbi:hypothetical protein L2E82_16230 [Cichorium intybus]|uniref:Uncharacterized protein n=1 Tax=Cichorium intybus TaxID=13427 RepID=A0ACB9F4A7_CICIN|nr:hypothetical protein L2E82_16230 [Cichorium intybus]
MFIFSMATKFLQVHINLQLIVVKEVRTEKRLRLLSPAFNNPKVCVFVPIWIDFEGVFRNRMYFSDSS